MLQTVKCNIFYSKNLHRYLDITARDTDTKTSIRTAGVKFVDTKLTFSDPFPRNTTADSSRRKKLKRKTKLLRTTEFKKTKF
jgi:hypothetical protein